jgi:hypothetical protein
MIQPAKHERLLAALFVLNLAWALWGFVLITTAPTVWTIPLALGLPLLPFSTRGFLAVLSKRQAISFGIILAIFLLIVFGASGLPLCVFFLPLWMKFPDPRTQNPLLACIISSCLLVVLIAVSLPRWPRRLAPPSDVTNLAMIRTGLLMYQRDHNSFPDKLSQLQEYLPTTRMFVSPRRAGEGYPWYRRLLSRGFHAESETRTLSWSEVDAGNYLYRQPPTNEPASTIMAMTRPWLYNRTWIMVLPVEGGIERLDADVWKHRSDVRKFLQQTGVQQE